MICQNCGTQNIENSKFCIKCGSPINGNNIPNNIQNYNQPINIQQNSTGITTPPINHNMDISNNFETTNQTIINENIKIDFIEYFTIILAVLLNPSITLKDQLNKLSKFQNSAILSVIVAITSTLITLIKTIISTVRVTTQSLFSEAKTEWVWENLKEIEFVKIIAKNLFLFLGIIFAIACVYYMVGLILKKQSNFSRLLGISAISIVPIVLCALLLSPILAMVYTPLSMGITLIGASYTLIIVYETMNAEIPFEGNTKYYFNLICLSIILIAGYFGYMKFFTTPVSDLSNVLDMFG